MSQPIPKDEPMLIVGAGVFGLTTALELRNRGYTNISVLDRYLPPVPDGSSVDISRVIRTEYADALYAKMAKEAYKGWVADFKSCYYESGFVMLANQTGSAYAEKANTVTTSQGARLDVYEEAQDMKRRYPSIQARLDGLKAWHNPKGGWADAGASIRLLSLQCSHAGISFITGKRGTVVSLKYRGRRVIGVVVSTGDTLLATQVILATGAWTNRLVNINHATSASGQPVGFIQITPQEAEKIREMPVIINMSTGVFCFPPTPSTNILKIARHGYGYETTVKEGDRLVSSPKRDSNNATSSYLPEDADKALRDGLRQLLPEFSDRPWAYRRLCWYSDTQEGDFVVDYHPQIPGLFLATGGAGQ
jgi:sarcosine oxidase / L-pipecolate oxidase